METAQYVLEELGELAGVDVPQEKLTIKFALDKEYETLLHFIDYASMSVDAPVQRSGFLVVHVFSMFLILELHGYIIGMSGDMLKGKG